MFRAAVIASALFLVTGSFTGTREELSSSAALLTPPAPELAIEFALEPIRAAVHLSYRNTGMGEVRISNEGARLADGLHLRVGLPGREGLLPEPLVVPIPSLEPGASASLRVLPRFSPEIMTERVSELLFRVELFSASHIVLVRETLVPLLAPSEVTWDLPERIAALVDPQSVARLVRGALAPLPPSKDLCPVRNLFLAAQVFDTLAGWGFQYLEDSPVSGAAALLGTPVDRVGLPSQTLLDHAGDCDDLTVLLASAFEAVGLVTAISVFEDHLFTLFDIGLPASRLEEAAVDREGLLERGGRAWVPVEATRLTRPKATLLSAWNAARPRLPSLRLGEGRLFEVRAAWSQYPSLALGGDGAGLLKGFTPLPGASAREIGEVIRTEARFRAERERTLHEGAEPGEAERRAAAVLASAGLHAEAVDLLRRAVALRPDPGARLELAGVLIQRAPSLDDLAAARSELEHAFRHWDPLDLAARSETLKRLAAVHRLRGDRRSEEEAVLAEGALFAAPLTAPFPGPITGPSGNPRADPFRNLGAGRGAEEL